MTPIEQFLRLLEEREILSASAVANLRAQVARSPTPVSAESIAKRLVKHGHLTLAQAKRLLTALNEPPPAERPTTGKAAKHRPPADDDSSLDLAPLDDEPTASAKAKRARKERPAKPAAQPSAQRSQPAAPRPNVAKPARESLVEQEMSFRAPAMGELDGLMADPSTTATPASPLTAASRGKSFLRIFQRQPKARKQTESEKWGSPLMLLGGGALLIMLFACGLLYWTLTRGNAEKMLQPAEDSYKQGSYLQAAKQYEDFLAVFPKDASASHARVMAQMAKLRQATLPGSDWVAALKASEDALQRTSTEKEFKDAYPELAAMLPAIAEGLADTARKKLDPKLVEKSRQALGMVEKYVPKTLRQASTSKLSDVQGSLAITVRQIARGDQLQKTLTAMRTAIQQSKTADAYTASNALLRQYPDLADDAKLKAALLEVSQTQQTLVKWIAKRKPPVAAHPADVAAAVITPARRDTKSELSDVAGQSVLAAVDGAIYGLDAASGKLLWRRFIGFDANPRTASMPIVPLSSEGGGDALIVDTARNELVRIESASGRVRWRYAVGEPFDARPVVADENILLATPSGKLITIAAATGESAGYVQLPQPLGVSPAVDGRRSLIYQVATHANLFILALADGACRHVDYLGQDRGSVVTEPLLVDDFLLLIVNDGARDAQLRVFLIQPKDSKKPEPWLRLVQQIPLGGLVATPAVADGHRVLVATTSGIVRVFDVGGAQAKEPLRQIAESAVEGAPNVVRFPLLQAGQLWIADNRLAKYDVQATRGRLEPKWIEDDQSAFLQPPVAVGQAVVGVRKKQGIPGAIVSARGMAESELNWSTQLAAPPAGEPQLLDDGSVVVVTAGGAVFKVPAGEAKSGILSDPLVPPDVFRLPPPVKHVVPLAGGLLAMSGGRGTQQIGIFDPKSPTPLVTWLKFDKLACPPVALGAGLLIATSAGQVGLYDTKANTTTGDPVALAAPFQPRLEVDTQIDWLTPTVINDREVLITDGRSKIYRLCIQDTPKPHLAVLAETTVTKPIVSPFAVLGNAAYATDAGKLLVGFSLAKLVRHKDISLGGQFAWGPARLGDAVLLATDDHQLLAIDGRGKPMWQAPLPHGLPAGTPLRVGGHYLMATRDGTIVRLDAATGKELAKLDVGCPLASGPIVRGGRLLVAGYDGTLHEVGQP
ncbi:MAG: PQQ-binding-like beta-propeller repeat protein [Thermoguttaceae bacterium]